MGGALLAGIDVGTTGVRCIVFDTSGRRVSGAYEEYPLEELGDGQVEQSVPLLLAATAHVCAEASAACADAGDIVSVGVSTQMSNTCALSASGELVRPMISWRDRRAGDEAARIAQQITPERFRAITGGPITPQLLLPRILWLREHEPATVERTAVWSQVQDLVLRFLGADDFYVDSPQAFAYGLWDVGSQRWSDELLALAGIEPSELGSVVPAGTRVGAIGAAAAERTGIPAGAALCAAAGDQICGVVGMGAMRPDTAAITLGTGGALLLTVDAPRTDLASVFTLNHVVPGRWALFAPTLSAASAFGWFRDVFGEPERAAAPGNGDVFDRLDGLAAHSPAGSNGLVFLPFLSSAGAPRWNPAASGAFLGITQQTERADFARAVMEGVVLEMRDNLLYMEAHGLGPERIRIGGGATRSELWTQIQADVYGLPVERLTEAESTALGAAVLAGVGSGVFADHDQAIGAMVHVEATIEPDPARHDRYSTLHATFTGATDALAAATFDALAASRADDREGSPG